MTFQRAVARYRDRAGDDFTWPDYSKSIEISGRWHLRSADGEPLAIINRDGRILTNGTEMTGGDAA